MQNIERRISALENQSNSALKWLWRNAAETQAQAIERAGLSQSDVIFVFQWADVKDEHHAYP